MLLLRDFRKHLGLTATELARRMGVSLSLVSRVELGRELAYPKFRRRAAEVLGIPEKILWPDQSARLQGRQPSAHTESSIVGETPTS